MKLPKVSFTDDKLEENGSKMLSRMGKMTTYNYPIFRGQDPVAQHEEYLQSVAKRDMDHPERQKKLAIQEEKQKEANVPADTRSKTDINTFLKRMT